MNAPLEVDEQLALAQYLDTRGDLLWFHPANERKCSPREGARLKRLGVKAGVPDVLIFDRPRYAVECIGTAIELKRVKGSKTSAEQIRWLKALDLRGWYCLVCHGSEDAISEIKWLYPRKKGKR